MKKILLSFGLALLFAVPGHAIDLSVDFELSTLGPNGDVLVFLFNSETGWSSDRELKMARVSPSELRAGVKFNDLEPGEYAVTAFQDSNGNNIFDRVLGLPTEKYALSNYFTPPRIPPQWSDVRFHVPKAQAFRIRLPFH